MGDEPDGTASRLHREMTQFDSEITHKPKETNMLRELQRQYQEYIPTT